MKKETCVIALTWLCDFLKTVVSLTFQHILCEHIISMQVNLLLYTPPPHTPTRLVMHPLVSG